MSESRSERRTRLRRELETVKEPQARLAGLLGLTEELSDGAALESEPLAHEAQELARALGDKTAEAEAETHLANIAWRSGDADAATRHAEQALALARVAADVKHQASAWSLLGIIHSSRAEYDEARRCLEQCVAAARQVGYQLGIQSGLNELGNIALLQGRSDEALRAYQESLQLNDETGDRYTSAGLHVNVGLVLEQLGRWEDAAGSLYRAIGICGRQDFGDIRCYALNTLGELFLKRGRALKAAQFFEQVVAAGRAGATGHVVMRDGLVNLGRALMLEQDVAGAQAAFVEALRLCRDAQDRRGAAVCLVRMAELALSRGESVAAGELAAEGLAGAQELELRTEAGEAMLVQARLCAGRGERVQARQLLEQAVDVLGTGEEGFEAARARVEYGRVLLGSGDCAAAREQLRVAAGTFRRLGAPTEAAAAGRLAFEVDRRTDPDQALLRAVSGLAALGLDPKQHVDEVLAMLCSALRFDSGAVVREGAILAGAGRPMTGTEAAEPGAGSNRLVVPIRVSGRAEARLLLERKASGIQEPDAAVLDTVASLLVVPVQRLSEASASRDAAVPDELDYDRFVGSGAAMRRALAAAARLARSRAPVLVCGESGSGRRTLARAILRSGEPGDCGFAVVNCAVARRLADAAAGRPRALLLVRADRAAPALRADIRAAHESGIRMVGTAGPGQPDRAGWELEFETLALPPLRERLDDLAGLARHLIVRLNREFGRQVVGIEPDALARLAGHWWPGNVSELAQVLEQAVLLASGPLVAAGDLPDLTGAVPASD